MRRSLPLLVALLLGLTVLVAPASAKPKPAAPTEHVTFTPWDFGDAGVAPGEYSGTTDDGTLHLSTPTGSRPHTAPAAAPTPARTPRPRTRAHTTSAPGPHRASARRSDSPSWCPPGTRTPPAGR